MEPALEPQTPSTLLTDPPTGEPFPLKSYADRLKETLDNPELIHRVYAHMANGGDLITFCENYKIRYSDLANWLQADVERIKIFTKAGHANDEWMRNRILKELGEIGLLDLREAFNEDGTLKKPREWPDSVARALAAVQTEETFAGSGENRKWSGWTQKLKMNDKIKALQMIGQEKGMFAQKHQVEGHLKLEEFVAGSWDEEGKEKK